MTRSVLWQGRRTPWSIHIVISRRTAWSISCVWRRELSETWPVGGV